MSKPFALNTGDPGFDPTKPITVNGYLFEPARGMQLSRKPVVKQLPRRERVTVEVERG